MIKFLINLSVGLVKLYWKASSKFEAPVEWRMYLLNFGPIYKMRFFGAIWNSFSVLRHNTSSSLPNLSYTASFTACSLYLTDVWIHFHNLFHYFAHFKWVLYNFSFSFWLFHTNKLTFLIQSILYPLKPWIKSHLLFAGIIRSSPFSPR